MPSDWSVSRGPPARAIHPDFGRSLTFGPQFPRLETAAFLSFSEEVGTSIAAPSLRNSGFETTAKGCLVAAPRAALTFAAVPTGTVDLSTTTA